MTLSSHFVLAQENHVTTKDQDLILSGEHPLMLTDSQSFKLPSGETYTSENTIVVAETELQKKVAELWFLDQMNKAQDEGAQYRVVGVTTEGGAEIAAARDLALLLPKKAKVATATIKKPLLDRIKEAAARAKERIKKPFARWVEKHPDQFKTVFAIARGGLNGTFSSYVFNYFFLDGAIPTWLAWSAGLTLGTISGVINYFSDPYSHWMDRAADKSTHDFLLKFFPFLNEEKVNELKSLSKWAFLEALFLAVPISFFQFLPELLNMGHGFTFASTWLAGLFAVSMSFATGMFAQYPWEKGISRAHTSDTLHAPDHIAKNWVKFRTALMFVGVSALQVTVTSLSLGDYKIASYLALGALGLAGIEYRRKTVERTNKEKAEKVLNSSAKKCPDLLSYLIPNNLPNSLSWVS